MFGLMERQKVLQRKGDDFQAVIKVSRVKI